MNDNLTGAWTNTDNNKEQVLLFVDGYHSKSVFSKGEKSFTKTSGGTYLTEGNHVTINTEFDTADNERTGSKLTADFLITSDELTIDLNDSQTTYKRIDDASAPLTGAWHITAQMRQGTVVPIHRTGTRKTLKILSGTRFQWIAIDPATKEFFGTGGGVYQFLDGKYTEVIEFFSRDGNRVGASLTFDGKLENGEWHQSGLSSKGEAIYEIWSRVKY